MCISTEFLLTIHNFERYNNVATMNSVFFGVQRNIEQLILSFYLTLWIIIIWIFAEIILVGVSFFFRCVIFWSFEEKLFILFRLASLLENAAEWKYNSGKTFPDKQGCSLGGCTCNTDTFLKVSLNLWSTAWFNRKYRSKKISLYFASDERNLSFLSYLFTCLKL